MTDKSQWPAFPATHFDFSENEHGLTLRDYFAAKAMVVYWSSPDVPDSRKAAAEWAYLMADEMMKAREV